MKNIRRRGADLLTTTEHALIDIGHRIHGHRTDLSHYCEMSNLYIQIKLCLRAVSTFVQGYRINPTSELSCSYLFYVKCPVMLSGVLLLLSPPSPEPSPSRAATGRAGSQLRSGEEPGAQQRHQQLLLLREQQRGG